VNPIDATAAVTAAVIAGHPATNNGVMTINAPINTSEIAKSSFSPA
jgi:hypothetical protein